MIHPVLLVLALASLWLLLTEDASAPNLVLGLLIAALGLAFVRRGDGSRGGGGRLAAGLRYVLTLLADLVSSSINLAWDVLTPRDRAKPRVVRIPLRIRGDGAITALASSITLTPGSLTIDVVGTAERPELLIHLLYANSEAEAVAEIRAIEDRLIAALPTDHHHPEIAS